MTVPHAVPTVRSASAPAVQLITAEDAPLLLRDLFTGGDPGPIVAALAQVPELCLATLPFIGAALGPSWVPIRLKEIAILRTSALLGCRYCVDAHTVVAYDVGFDADQLGTLRAESTNAASFRDPTEAAVLRWVDQVAGRTGPLERAAATELGRFLPDHAIVELTVTVGATMFLNRFATALRLPSSAETLAKLAALGMDRWNAGGDAP